MMLPDEDLDELAHKVLARLGRMIHNVTRGDTVRRARARHEYINDGYSASSMSWDHPAGNGMYSDPTGNAAVNLAEYNERTVTLIRGVNAICNILGELDHGLAGPPECRSCARIGEHSPIRTAGLCRWCQDHKRDMNGPSLKDLKAHHAGLRVSRKPARG
jgi:hypothetical protein